MDRIAKAALIALAIMAAASSYQARAGAAAGAVAEAVAEAVEETVVILHGIGRTSASMNSIETRLREEGYATLNITYPSTELDLDGLADQLGKNFLTEDFWQRSGIVNFVTHSMGGLLARRYLERNRQDKVGRVVMLAPPIGGSEVADVMQELPLYRWFYGPAGQELTTAAAGGAAGTDAEEPYYEVGIIAGTKEWPYFVAAFIVPGASDGRVSVENTKLAGMKDHTTVPATHTFIMARTDVHDQIVHFLQQGKFKTAE